MQASLFLHDFMMFSRVNEEGLTALDIAMLTNHVPMIKILLKYGAKAKVLGMFSLCWCLNNSLQP